MTYSSPLDQFVIKDLFTLSILSSSHFSITDLFILLSLIVLIIISLMLIGSDKPEEPMSGVRCPKCKERGVETWVIPGKNCHVCGTACDY